MCEGENDKCVKGEAGVMSEGNQELCVKGKRRDVK